jgi:hypothetical protein
MMFRTFFSLTVVGGIALWTQAGSEPVAGWIARGKALVAQVQGRVATALPAGAGTGTGTGTGTGAGAGAGAPAPGAAAGAVRKCLHQGQVLYTTQDCPAGALERAVSGEVSTLPDSREAVAAARAAIAPVPAPAQGGPAAAAGPAGDGKAAPKNPLREKLIGPDDPEARLRAIDRAVGN